jgi:uncharacterized protein (UPF0264 family)
MRLLVSVANGDEAAAALAGGADIIDAKDPAAGPLGAVTIAVLREIAREVCAARDAISRAVKARAAHEPDAAGGARLLTAALGDAADEGTVERAACAFALAGATLVKVGFAGIATSARADALLRAAMRGATAGSAGSCSVVAVAYADAQQAASLSPHDLVDAAASAGTAGVLLDTATKHGPGVRGLLSEDALSAWVARAHQAGLMVAVAGRLQADDLEFVRNTGADIAGVRGAACEGGRTGRISSEKVRVLVARLRRALTEGHDAH